MALWFPIMVNKYEVGSVVLVRIAPVDHMPQENEECTYKLNYYYNSGEDQALIYAGEISHPYIPYNPVSLLAAALEKIKDNNG